MSSILLGVASEVELLDHIDLGFLSACDRENVHVFGELMYWGTQFVLYTVQSELCVN